MALLFSDERREFSAVGCLIGDRIIEAAFGIVTEEVCQMVTGGFSELVIAPTCLELAVSGASIGRIISRGTF